MKTAKTSRELFSETLVGDHDDARPWEAVHELRNRNSVEVFELAKQFCRSPNPRERARGLDVLAQLGAGRPMPERPYFDKSVLIAITHLCDDDPEMVHCAAWALAHLGSDSAISALIDVRRYSDSRVRLAVAVGVGISERPDAIQTLLGLMTDADDEVRNWATFGIGNLSIDSPEIRLALRTRLWDPFADARDEAIWGLANRKDPAGLQMLLERLQADSWVAGDEHVAADVLGLPNALVADLRRGVTALLSSEPSAC